MSEEEFTAPILLNLGTNIHEWDISEKIIAEVGRNAWEELSSIAQSGYLHTNNKETLDKIKVILTKCNVSYYIEEGKIFKFSLKMFDKKQAIIYPV